MQVARQDFPFMHCLLPEIPTLGEPLEEKSNSIEGSFIILCAGQKKEGSSILYLPPLSQIELTFVCFKNISNDSITDDVVSVKLYPSDSFNVGQSVITV